MFSDRFVWGMWSHSNASKLWYRICCTMDLLSPSLLCCSFCLCRLIILLLWWILIAYCFCRQFHPLVFLYLFHIRISYSAAVFWSCFPSVSMHRCSSFGVLDSYSYTSQQYGYIPQSPFSCLLAVERSLLTHFSHQYVLVQFPIS